MYTIPTVELHRHFEAGIRPETIARLAQRHGVTEVRTRSGQLVAGVDPQDPDSIRRYYRDIAAGFGGHPSAAAAPGTPPVPDGFARFVDSFGLPLSVLRSLEDLEQAVFDQLVDCAARGSLHTELRGSPFTYRDTVAATLEEIATALVGGVDRAWTERGVSGTFILAFSRQKGLDPAAEGCVPHGADAGLLGLPDVKRLREFALARPNHQAPVVAELAARVHRADRVVGLDIAGFPEATFPPRAFREALAPAREAGVPLTVHAGEQGVAPDFAGAPPELVVEAIDVLGARRIGHGTSLAGSTAARALVRERQIGVECCPVSNERMGFMPVAQHPLPRFLADALLVSVSTDDPLMFGPFTVAETFEAIAGPLRLDRSGLVQLTRNGIESAFVTDERRAILRSRLDAALNV